MKKKLLSKLLVLAMSVSLFSGVSQPAVAADTNADAGTIGGTSYDAGSLAVAKNEEEPGIQNDVFWRDTDGNIIYSQGGGIFKFGDTYYWYGVKYVEAEQYANNPITKYDTDVFAGVTCYSSKDLVNWKSEGLVVKPEEVSKNADINGQDAVWVGRLGVAKVGDKYALLVQHECPETEQTDATKTLDYPDVAKESGGKYDGQYYSKQVLVLASDTPNGEFKWNQRINMCDYTGGTSNTGDQTVFTDEATGKSYLVYSYGRGRGRMFLSEIVAQDGGKIGLAKSHTIYNGAGREGNCMFKYNNKYYVCASDLYGWNASHAYYLVLDSLEDSYLDSFTAVKNMTLMDGSSDDFCHVSQTGFFYTVEGSEQETVIFCGDRWADFARNGLGYNQWCPLSFNDKGEPYFNSLSAWDLDAKTGKWTVHASNNYVKNGSFDADRVAQQSLAGWTNTVNKGNAPINNNGDTVTGKYALKLGDSVDFDCKVSQNITSAGAVTLPDGKYNLTAKLKNSGTFDELSMYVKSGGLMKKSVIKNANASYTEVILPDVTVSGGEAEVGFVAKGKANASAFLDDVTFVRAAEQTADTGSIDCPINSDVAKDVTVTAVSEDGTTIYVYETKMESGNKTYALNSVKAGTYTITVAANSCVIAGSGQKVTVAAGQSAKANAITVTNQGGNINGKVVNEEGQGIEDVIVTLTKDDTVVSTKTGTDGVYFVEDVLAGTYTIEFEKDGYVSPGQITVDIEVGKTVEAKQQKMKNAMGVVNGIVWDNSGKPVGNATVILRGCKTKDDDRRYTVNTDADGKYSVNLIEDTYQILAFQNGVSVPAIAKAAEVERGRVYTRNMTMPEKTIAVPNGDLESDFTEADWTNSGSRGKWTNRAADVLSGKGGYNIWDQKEQFTVELNQTLKNLENGRYIVTVKADSGFDASDELYLYAKDAQGTLLSKEDIPNISIDKQGEVIGLYADVTDGTLTIGISGNMTGSKLSSGAWSHVDDFCVAKIADTDEEDAVTKLIDDIGTVELTSVCKDKIDTARAAYEGLSETKQALITNIDTLTTAEDRYKELSERPVEEFDITKASVSGISSKVYTGKEIKPNVTVKLNNKTLKKDRDYTLKYANNKNIGTAKVTITGKGNYKNSLTKTFKIIVTKGQKCSVGNYQYQITNVKGAVAVTGGKKKTMASVNIGAAVKIGGKSFKITSVGKNAFKGYKKLNSVTVGSNVKNIESGAFYQCGKLKMIKINSSVLTGVGKNAIKGINKTATIQCPKKKLVKYKKLFNLSTGYKKTMKIK